MAVPSLPDGPDAALAAQFEAIRRQFVAGLARRRQEIEAAPDADALHAALHRLAGAAGGYGYAALGQTAVAAMRAGQAGDGAALAAALKQLRQEIDLLAG
jgi:HPt (histidine-containing phosphotransfer) domain-containing protein